MIAWLSTEFCGSSSQALLRLICQSALDFGRRCISVLVIGTTAIRSTGILDGFHIHLNQDGLIDSTAGCTTRASSSAVKNGLKNR